MAPLPANVPRFVVEVAAAGATTQPIAVSVVSPTPDLSLAAIVDRRGRLLWYRAPPPGDSFNDFERHPNGRFTLWRASLGAFEVFDFVHVFGAITHHGTDWGIDNHDIQLLPAAGQALVLGQEDHPFDSRPFVPGGSDRAVGSYGTVSLLDAGGQTVFHWSSYPEIGPDETTADTFAMPNGATFGLHHPNSLFADAAGDILVSFRQTDAIYKIDRATGALRWRLGGKRSDFQFVGDPLGGFSHQHDADFVDNGDVLLFDNGNLHTLNVSRAVQYHLDETAHTATLVWQYQHDPPIGCPFGGSTHRIAGGNTVIGWSTDGRVTEVDRSGRVVWEMTIANRSLYRAYPIDLSP